MAVTISPERFVNELPAISSPRLSPDARTIAFVRSQVSRTSGTVESNIWLAHADGGNQRQITHTSPTNGSPAWSPDGRCLAFVTSRDDKSTLAIMDVAQGGESRVITQRSSPIFGFAWSPEGASIAFISPVDPENPNETPRDPKAPAAVRVVKRIDYKQDGFGFVNDTRAQIFTVDVASSTVRQLTHDTIDHLGPTWSPDGARLFVQLPHHNGLLSRIGIIAVDSGELHAFGADNASLGPIAWSPDGSKILYSEGLDIKPGESYYLYDVATGTSRRLTEEAPYMVYGSPTGGAWTKGTKALVQGFSRGAVGMWSLNTESGELEEIARLEALGYEVDIASDGSIALIAVTSIKSEVGIARIDLATGTNTLLFNAASDYFAESPGAGWEHISIERGGETIESWLLKPADFDERKRYPLLLEVHGGPHGFHGYGINPMCEVLASNGFLVLAVNPRGSGSYSADFARACIGDWGGEDWLDLLGSVDEVLKRPYADADRTGIMGYSYGGYMTSWSLGQTDRFKAAVVGAPVFDLESFFGTSDVGHIFGARGFQQTPWDDRETMLAHSPSEHIQKAVTPTLIVHGEADERCPIGQGEQLFVSLEKLGVDTTFVRYPGGSHSFPITAHPLHRIDFLTQLVTWFKKYLGDPI